MPLDRDPFERKSFDQPRRISDKGARNFLPTASTGIVRITGGTKTSNYRDDFDFALFPAIGSVTISDRTESRRRADPGRTGGSARIYRGLKGPAIMKSSAAFNVPVYLWLEFL